MALHQTALQFRDMSNTILVVIYSSLKTLRCEEKVIILGQIKYTETMECHFKVISNTYV